MQPLSFYISESKMPTFGLWLHIMLLHFESFIESIHPVDKRRYHYGCGMFFITKNYKLNNPDDCLRLVDVFVLFEKVDTFY